MEYYVKGDDRKGYSNREELDQEEEEEEEDKNNIINSTKYLSSPCYNYGSSSSPSLQSAEAINFMDLSLTNPKDDNNNNDNDWPPDNEREHMFDKVVTPSDVGKLNRLVIPKHHAEKYFPLDSSANEKGLLLNFVDRARKPWRFRYSYWNSSQSYVMTKGWSRFVKDKKLDAGDIVSFQRSVKDSNVLYIDWRRRPPPPLSLNQQAYPFWGTGGGGGRFYLPSMPMPFRHIQHENFHYNINHHPYHHHHHHHRHHHHNQYQFQHTSPYQMQPYYQNGHGGIGSHQNMVIDSVPIGRCQPHHSQQVMKAMSPASNKRLRLFGVNMECSSTTTMQEDEGQKILASTVASLSPHQQLNPVELRLLPNYGAPLGGADDDQQQQLGVSEKGKSTCLSFFLDP